jgi:hypothetical protein
MYAEMVSTIVRYTANLVPLLVGAHRRAVPVSRDMFWWEVVESPLPCATAGGGFC